MTSGIYIRTKKNRENLAEAQRKKWQDSRYRARMILKFKRRRDKNAGNYKDGRTLRKYYCMDCSKGIGSGSKRCHSCNSKITIKKQWQRGDFDGIFKSPTKPEKAIMKLLQFLNLDYIFQYRPKSYSKIYDFYIPKKNLLIEYDSKYWHSLPKMKERDKEKTKYAKNNNYRLLRIME